MGTNMSIQKSLLGVEHTLKSFSYLGAFLKNYKEWCILNKKRITETTCTSITASAATVVIANKTNMNTNMNTDTNNVTGTLIKVYGQKK